MGRCCYLLSADTEMNDKWQCKYRLFLCRNLCGLVKTPLSFICFKGSLLSFTPCSRLENQCWGGSLCCCIHLGFKFLPFTKAFHFIGLLFKLNNMINVKYAWHMTGPQKCQFSLLLVVLLSSSLESAINIYMGETQRESFVLCLGCMMVKIKGWVDISWHTPVQPNGQQNTQICPIGRSRDTSLSLPAPIPLCLNVPAPVSSLRTTGSPYHTATRGLHLTYVEASRTYPSGQLALVLSSWYLKVRLMIQYFEYYSWKDYKNKWYSLNITSVKTIKMSKQYISQSCKFQLFLKEMTGTIKKFQYF